jgi:hypothetical protein
MRRLAILAAAAGLVVCGAALAGEGGRETQLASTGPLAGGPDSLDLGFGFPDISEDGVHVVFSTDEPLVTEDGDAERDIYERANGVTSLVSTSPAAGGIDSADATLDEITEDGEAIFFSTTEPLTDTDNDASFDGYVRRDGVTTLVTLGAGHGGMDSSAAILRGIAAEGQVAYFTTIEPLGADPDDDNDVYRRDLVAGTTALISQGPLDGDADSSNASFGASSEDGSVAYFYTDEPITSDDNDTDEDLYRRNGGTDLVTHGPNGGGADSAFISHFIGAGVGPDNSLLFWSAEPLAAGDGDVHVDVYRTSALDNGEPTMISEGPRDGGPDSADATPATPGAAGHDFIRTVEPLTFDEEDPSSDIYERFGGTTTLLTDSPSAGGLDSAGIGAEVFSSADGLHLLFATPEQLGDADVDANFDAYERFQGVTRLVSDAPAAGGGDSSGAIPVGISSDGSRLFFRTEEPLTAEDTDQRMDIYERFGGTTRLASGGPLAGGADAAHVENTRVAAGGAVLFTTFEPLTADDTDLNEDAYASRILPPVVTPPPGDGDGGDTDPPVVEAMRISPARIVLGRALPALTSLAKRTTISFRLSEAASVRVTFARARPGRRVRGRCRRPTRRNARRPRCKRFVAVRGGLTFDAGSGDNRIRFSGRLTRRRSLKPGTYRVTLRPTDEAGNVGASESRRLRLLRRLAPR